jgi:putative alpha-1,2-mannosidase
MGPKSGRQGWAYEAKGFVPSSVSWTIENSLYIQSARLNGRPLDRAWIHYQEIAGGGTLKFEMGPEPNKSWASAPAAAPPSLSNSTNSTGE